jgi:heme exporter protein D
MNWSSLSEFLAMGGYGLYVWGSFGMCALVLAVESAALAARRKALRAQPLDEIDESNERSPHET